MDQPGRVANPARGQLSRGNDYFPLLVRASDIGLARQVRPSRPASACSFSTLRLNMVLTHGIPPDFRGGVHLFTPTYAIGLVPSLSGHHAFAFRWRSLPRARRHRASSPQGSSSNGCYCLCRGQHGPFFSLPRARQHKASSPQGSSSNGCCCLCRGQHGPINSRLSFPTPTIGMKWTC